MKKSPLALQPDELSPYRRVLPGDVAIEADPLLVRLDVHRESIVLHEYAEGSSANQAAASIRPPSVETVTDKSHPVPTGSTPATISANDQLPMFG